MTRGQILTNAIDMLREQSTPSGWTRNELERYLDDGYEELAEATGAVVETTTIAVLANQHFVDLPSNSLYPLALKDVATDLPIDLKHWTWIDALDNRFIERSRDRPLYAASWGLDKLLIHPAYNANGTISMIHAIVPAAFTSDNDVPDLPEEYHRALQHYVVHRAILKDANRERLNRSLRRLRDFAEAQEDLDDWAQKRHEGIRFAVYGTQLRSGESLVGGT